MAYKYIKTKCKDCGNEELDVILYDNKTSKCSKCQGVSEEVPMKEWNVKDILELIDWKEQNDDVHLGCNTIQSMIESMRKFIKDEEIIKKIVIDFYKNGEFN